VLLFIAVFNFVAHNSPSYISRLCVLKQLSYEYYKQYEIIDQRFDITSKMNAWNRVFVEGKQKFDAWVRP
jgi:hypothetical protein